jgi:hypothetical protein
MLKQERDASYVAKAEAKVNYPKLKKDKKTASAAGTRPGDGRDSQGGAEEAASGGGSVQLPDIRRLSVTMTKVYPTGSEEPSIELLVDILHNNTVFDAAENRRELEQIITKFIAEKTANS